MARGGASRIASLRNELSGVACRYYRVPVPPVGFVPSFVFPTNFRVLGYRANKVSHLGRAIARHWQPAAGDLDANDQLCAIADYASGLVTNHQSRPKTGKS